MQFSAAYGFCEQGSRPNQQDFVFPSANSTSITRFFFAVCDGVGGNPCGEIAAQVTAEALSNWFLPLTLTSFDRKNLSDLTRSVSQSLRGKSFQMPDCHGMATTLVAITPVAEKLLVIWCGDSRVYHFREEKCIWLTTDHNLATDLAREGSTADLGPRGRMLTRSANSTGMNFNPENQILEVQPGDRFLLCSDGVHGFMEESDLAEMIIGHDLETAVAMIMASCAVRSRDNYSGWLMEIQ